MSKTELRSTNTSSSSSSSSISTTAHCGLWPVQQCSSTFFLSATNSVHLLTPSTWGSLSTSSFQLFLSLPLLLVPSSSWVKIFMGILSSSILSMSPKTSLSFALLSTLLYILPLLISSNSRFVRLFLSSFSYLGPYILLNIFVSKMITVCSFFVNFHKTLKLKLNSVALVRTRTIPTERPPPVGEVSANFCG